MGPANAAEGTGRMLCAGPSALVEQLGPALAAMTGELVKMGDDVTRPCSIKLVGNAMIIGVTAVLADAFALAQGAGLQPADVLAFVSNFPVANIANARGARMVQGDYAPSFELAMARKDVRLMQQTADGRPLAMLDGLARRMDALIADGHGAKDLAALSVDTIPPRS